MRKRTCGICRPKRKKREGIDTTGRSGNNIFLKARSKRRDTTHFCIVQGRRQTMVSLGVEILGVLDYLSGLCSLNVI